MIGEAQFLVRIEGENCDIDLLHHRPQERRGFEGAQALLLKRAAQRVDFEHHVAKRLVAAGIRARVDESSETVGKRVRAAQLLKTPYVLVVGDAEASGGALTVRDRIGTETKDVAVERFVDALRREIDTRALGQTAFGG